MRKKEEILRKKETTIRRQNPKENKRGKYIQSVIKNKKLLAIMLVLVLVVLAIIVASNQEIRKNVIQAFNGEIQNAEEDEKIEVYENGSAILTDDAAIITSASVVSRKTGTGPFDENDEPGNDSSETNDIVRSFDTVSWTIEATMDLKEGEGVDSITGGKINIEATLPEECANVMEWDVESMQWLEGSGVVSEDGRILTGRYTMGEETTTIPGKQNLELILQVYGAKNGTNIEPEIKIWLDGNTEEEKKMVEIEPVIVSATEKYNVELQRNIWLQKEIDVEMEETVRGRVYGYSLVYQLYNDDGVEKGLKGVQYPESNTMTLDVNLKLEKVNVNDSNDVQDITDTSTPILYNYDINNSNSKEGNIANRPMNIVNNSQYNPSSAPSGNLTSAGSDYSCYDSGNVVMEQKESQIQVTISNYQFNGEFPKYYAADATSDTRVKYEKNIGCFSSVYFMVFVPYTEENSEEGYNYYLTVEDENLQEVNTENETKELEQKVSTDDISRYQHQLSIGGSFNEYHWLNSIWTNSGSGYTLATHYNYGNAKAEIGQKFIYKTDISTDSNNDLKDDIYDANVLMKFDGEAFDISEIDGKVWNDEHQYMNYSNTKMEFNMLYAGKPDGTNWTDDTEMQSAEEEDLKFYTSLEALKEDLGENAICVGVLFESIDGYQSYGVRQCLEVALQVTDEAEIGKVYQFVSVTRMYKEDNQLDRTTQTRENPDAVFPEADVEIHRNYVKSEYDENGQIKTGTHLGGYSNGQSLLIVAGNLTVEYAVSDLTSDGSTKTNYDLGRGENTVGYTIKPQLTSKVVEGAIKESNVTITVKDTLPKGLTYVPGSSDYEEPEIIENDDGSTTLVWEIYNCTVGEEIREINFRAKIDENTANSTQYESTVIVSADKIGTYVPSTRTDSTTIQITNLSSHRLYKETETEIAEANGEVTYKITYQNNTDTSVPDFQILDILPYNGDGRGTAYTGTYTLKNVNVTQTGADGQEISIENLSLYTTTSPDARKITPKDESIGVSEIWQEKEIGAEIGEAVTVLALKGEIGNNTNIEIEITLKATNNRSGDVYYNQATAQTSKDTDIITSTSAKSEIVSRQISGMVWYDTNENGVKDTEESYANRIEVELLKADGSKAVDYNGNEISNVLTDSNGEYSFSNLPIGEYIVEIQTEDKYTLTEANVGTNKEINSKFELTEEGLKQSYTITNLNNVESPNIIEKNVNAGLVVKDAKIIVKYLEEDATPETDEDNTVLKEQDEITTYEKDSEQVKYKLGDSYVTEPAEITDYIVIRNSGNTNGTLNTEETIVTYYYTYNKQDIEVTKVWEDNGNQAQKRPTSIKVTLKDGNATVKEAVLSEENEITEEEKAEIEGISNTAEVWQTTIKDVAVYDENAQKIEYTVDETEEQGSLESYNKTINGMVITNTFTQNTEKIEIPVTKIWNDNENKAEKRPENVTLILKREVQNTYVEVTRATINGTDNPGENASEWKYTFGNIAKYDENNDEINYVVEEIVPDFYTSKVEEVENTDEEDGTTEFTITNTFEVPNETINVEVTKVWSDNNNRAGKRPESTTLVLTGKNATGEEVVEGQEITLTKANAIDGNSGNNVGDSTEGIATNTTDTSTTWKGTIENLPKYDENADIINYELNEENLNNIFYTEANTTIDQQTKTVTNRFEVPDDKIEIEVNKKWEDNNNALGRRPESVTLYLTGNNQEYEITLTKANAIDGTTSDEQDTSTTWRGTIGNLPKYDVNGNEITYTVDERPIASEFYTKTGIDQGTKTITNTFAIPTETIQIPVTKIWEDDNNSRGKRPESITLQVINKQTDDVVASQVISGNRTSNDGWSYTFEVPKYAGSTDEVEYEVEEVINNEFYTVENAEIIGNQTDGYTVTNTFTVPNTTIDITVNKVWVDNEIQAQRRPDVVTINVKGENDQVVQSYDLNVQEGETSHTFTDLLKYNSDGNEIQYTVEEIEKAEGDLKFYTSSASKVINIENEDNKKQATITNTFTTPTDTTQIIVNKIWNDNEIQAQRRPDSVILVVKNGDEEVKTQEITKNDMVEGTTNQWSIVIDGLPKYDENGLEIQYGVEERATETDPDGLNFYEAEESTVLVEDGQATIRNSFVKPEDKISIIVNKIWNDNNDANDKRPTSIKLQVKDEDRIVEEAEVSDIYKKEGQDKEEVVEQVNSNREPEDQIPANQVEVWQYIFIDLFKYDENGQEIVYTASEEEVNTDDLKFYTNDGVTGDMEAGYSITNSFSVPDETIDLVVTKEWEDNSIQAQRRPESIIINVKALNDDAHSSEDIINTYELNVAEETSHTFTGLKKYNSQGNEIEYTVEEKEKNPDDLKFYSTIIGNMKNILNETNVKEIVMTNTFIKPEETTEVTVTKIWNDNLDEAEKRPDSVKLQLKNGTRVVQEQEVNTKNVQVVTGEEKEAIIQEINARNNGITLDVNEVEVWQYTFTDVEKYNDNGEDIVYTVDETEVNNNDLQFYTKETTGTTVINTFTQDTTKVNVTINKVWEDNDIQAQRRPESVVIVLKANGIEYRRYPLSETTSDSVTENTWTYTFRDLPKYDEYNNIIEYTVDEEEQKIGDLKFYTSKVDGYTITNTFTRPGDTISIDVHKVWEDQENVYSKRPEIVNIQVKNGENIVKEQTITKDEKWETRFTGLPKYDENGGEIQYTVEETEAAQNSLFYYEAEIGEVTDKVGTKNEKEVTVTNKMTKIPSTVEVRYVDKNTKEDISNSKIKEGIIGDTFDVTEDVKEIDGYTLVEEPAEKTGIYTEDTQEKIYYYAKNTNVIVKYLELDDTPENTADNELLAPEVTIDGYEGLDYVTEQKEIENYTFVESTDNTSGQMKRDQIVVIYYYAKNTRVTVKYLEKDETPEDNKDNQILAPEITINGYEGKEYTTTQENIPGYTFIESTNNTEGNMTEEPIEVIYYYAQNTRVVIKYLEQDDTPNDNTDNQVLAQEEIIEGYEGLEYNTADKEKEIENYELVGNTGNTKGIMTVIRNPDGTYNTEIEVIYYYLQKSIVEVQHIDRETGGILKLEQIEGKVGDIIKTQAQNFEGYVLVESPENPDIEVTKELQIIKYYYAKVSEGVIEKHIDDITGELLYSEEHKGNEGDYYNIPAREFEGYDLVTVDKEGNNRLPENAEGEMKSDEVIEVNYYYIKKATVIVKYLEEDDTPEDITDNQVIAQQEVIKGHENDQYTTTAKIINGYDLTEIPENAIGTMVVTRNPDGTYNTEIEVIYYYKKVAGGVIENHIDIATGNGLATETHTGTVGDAYEIPAREFEGYDLVEVDAEGNNMLPTNAVGTMTEEQIIVNYYYEKQAKVTVQYIDKLTGEILLEEEITGHVGDTYTTEEKRFDGYDLTERPSNSTGEMAKEETFVKYYYERKAEVEIQYVEKDTNYSLAENEIIEGYVGDEYTSQGKNIEYYKLVGKTENATGTMGENKITVIYYYQKKVFNLSVDKYISNVKVDGVSQGTKTIDDKDELYMVSIHRSKTTTADIKVTYKIRITNTGEIEGTVGIITEYIPEGYSYYQEDNNIYWETKNGALVTESLATETIEVGEYKELEIVLRWNKGEDNFGEKNNVVMISGEENPAGFADANKEDNTSLSKMLITITTGLDKNDRIIMTALTTIVLAVILAGNIGFFIVYKKKRK